MAEATVNPVLYGGMEYRCIGPHRGGRVVAVAGDPAHKQTFYFGSTGGGVWKSQDGGKSWRNVSDGFFKTASVGALQVAASDPNVIYAGMGETSIRGNVSRGDGVYKSTDAGRTWQQMGLENTQNIGEIQIHPTNPDIVYVAAFGHVWGENQERGVYRSTDGGKTWTNVLFKSGKAGAVDLSMDPTNPRILYAAIWEANRGPHFMSSGGEDSGLWRSTDGGDSWTDISRNPGLPKEGVLGKIGVAASGAQAGRVYAIVEHENGALFRSDDWGDTWTRGSEDRNLRTRAWYYHHIYADPNDADVVWILNVQLWKSIDGGRNFTAVPVQHGDTHDFWIDPDDSNRIILGDDGGAEVSFTGGTSWSTIFNQPTAEFYHVTVDSREPYRVYGAQQDNTTMSVPSRSNYGFISTSEWYPIGGGESGYVAVKPDDPDLVFAGSYGGLLTRYDARTRLAKAITIWPEMMLGSAASEMKYRFQWTSPTVFSPHDPNVLYHGGNHVFRTTNQGHSWDRISPDLTRADPESLVSSGGPITKDNTGAETYATVFAIAESPVEKGLIWTGSDDGLIYLSRDGGGNWQNVTPGPDLLPEWSLISIVEPSHFEAGTCYVAATRYKSHDDAPYLLRTDDYGASWQAINTGIPEGEFTRVIREDTEVMNLLFAGTERGLYVSFDRGDTWQSLQLNLPVVPIHDLIIAQGDLVVATHGRSFWVLDDISPLRQLADGAVTENGTVLYTPRASKRWASSPGFGGGAVPGRNFTSAGGLSTSFEQITTSEGKPKKVSLDAGDNPPDGVLINYYLADAPKDPITLRILDGDGNLVREFSSKELDEKEFKDNPGKSRPPVVPAKQGGNRFVWDLRYPNATEVPDDTGSMGFARGATGPKAEPGSYQVEIINGGTTLTQPFDLLPDPRTGSSVENYREGFELAMQVRDKLSELHEGVNKLRAVRKQVDAWSERLGDEGVTKAGEALKDQLREVEDQLIQWRAKAGQDTLNFPVMLNAKLAALIGSINGMEGTPTEQSREVYADLAGKVDTQLKKLDTILKKEVPAFNAKVKAVAADAIAI
ncbi:MAG TPA: glycosyl hydrolase [Thermomicrobiales bacterium]|nr:glycosyl hydrolase [Thermomicrobiales bacterium]